MVKYFLIGAEDVEVKWIAWVWPDLKGPESQVENLVLVQWKSGSHDRILF